MKLSINLLIVLLLAIYSNCAKLVPMKVTTEKFTSLIGPTISCPNDGVIKNFVLRKSDEGYYFELECYSSDKEDVDYGEPIVKCATYSDTNTLTLKGSNGVYFSHIASFEMDCTPEYGLNGFNITLWRLGYSDLVLQKVSLCKPTKSSYVSKKELVTQVKQADSLSLDCYVDILVGSTDEENEDNIGFPLRSFQFKYEVKEVKYSLFNTKKTIKCYYIYSTSKLKNMGKLKDERLKQFAELRNKNTQVD